MKWIKIHQLDNVAVALEDIRAGETLTMTDGASVTAAETVMRGYKIALGNIPKDTPVIKYGNPIGLAKEDIRPGQWVHVHNVRTGLSEDAAYVYEHKTFALPAVSPRTFEGYRRPDGRVAVRNELWILPTVGCVNSVAETLARENQRLAQGGIDGLYAFPHPFGCSQIGDDHSQTRKLLAALARHPNAGGVLVLGLGCENLTLEQFQAELGEWDEQRVKFLICQKVEDEFEAGAALLKELAEYAGQFRRETLPASELAVGLKCGGDLRTEISCGGRPKSSMEKMRRGVCPRRRGADRQRRTAFSKEGRVDFGVRKARKASGETAANTDSLYRRTARKSRPCFYRRTWEKCSIREISACSGSYSEVTRYAA